MIVFTIGVRMTDMLFSEDINTIKNAIAVTVRTGIRS